MIMVSIRTKAMVVDISRSPLASSSGLKASSSGTVSGAVGLARRQRAAEGLAALVQVLHLRAVRPAACRRAPRRSGRPRSGC
jgi:hypothetical protein